MLIVPCEKKYEQAFKEDVLRPNYYHDYSPVSIAFVLNNNNDVRVNISEKMMMLLFSKDEYRSMNLDFLLQI